MLDPDDEQIIKDSKAADAVIVTWDRVVREAAGGLTPYEAMEMAKNEKKGAPEAQEEISRLRTLSPKELSALSEAGNETYTLFRQKIEVNQQGACLIRYLRVKESFSWRSIARYISDILEAPWGSNQLAGMVLCEKAAELLGEDFMEPPWN
ncbi:MAG: hypothetical protein ACFFDI_25080 [Promethearchaeota archaeon]